MKLSDESMNKLKYIHKNELLSWIDFITFDEYENAPEKTKEKVKERLSELKIAVGGILFQYLEEEYYK